MLPSSETPSGYSAVNEFKIGETVVPAFKSDEVGLGDYALIFAKGPSGYTGFYCYDTVEKTMQRLNNMVIPEEEEEIEVVPEPQNTNLVSSFVELNTNGKIVVITIVAVILLLIAAIVILIVKIVKAGKDDDYDEEDDEVYDNNDIVGFEYLSVDDKKEENEEQE